MLPSVGQTSLLLMQPQAQPTQSQDLFLMDSSGLECLNMSPIPTVGEPFGYGPNTGATLNNGSPLLDLNSVGYDNNINMQ